MIDAKFDATSLRSQRWFDNPDNIDMTALYLERYLNFGISVEELRSGKPIIGSRADRLVTCRRATATTSILAERVRDGITRGGRRCRSSSRSTRSRRPASARPPALDRNLSYLGLVEVLYGYPLDGVVLTIGCDKTTPACLMAAATVNIPAIALSVGPMLNGWHKGERTGSGTIVWKARELLAAREIDDERFMRPRRLALRRPPATATPWARPRP